MSAGGPGFGLASRLAPARHLTPVVVVLAAIAGASGAFESIDRLFVHVVAIGLAVAAVMYGTAEVLERFLKSTAVDHDHEAEKPA